MAEEELENIDDVLDDIDDMASAMGEESTLSQDEIDNLLGFDEDASAPKTGIEAILENSQENYERLPMLEVVLDRFSRSLSTTLRNFTGENADVNIESITSSRFEDYLNSVPLPALIIIFQAVEWENFGLITIDSSLTYTMVDILLGGGRTYRPIRIEGRPFTTIEQDIIKNLSKLILSDLSAAFNPLTPATLRMDRIETNPRFATIARPASPVTFVSLRVDIDERSGKAEILFPYSTLEPVKDLLQQMFDGESFGSDASWENYLSSEIKNTNVVIQVSLSPKTFTLKEISELKVGQTLVTDNKPNDDIRVVCQGIQVMSGKIGSSDNHVAVCVSNVNSSIVKDLI